MSRLSPGLNARYPAQVRFVVPRYGAEIVGGSEGLVRRLATHLASAGWTAQVCTTTAIDEATWRGDLPGAEVDHGVSVRRFRVVAARRPSAFHQVTRAFFRLPAGWRPESLWFRAQGPYTPSLIRAIRRLPPAPTIFTPYLYFPTVFGMSVAPHPRVLIPAAHDERPLRLRRVRRTVAACDALWYNSDEERILMETAHPVASSKPHEVGTIGFDVDQRGDARRFRSARGIEGPFLLYAGRRAAGKGFDELLSLYSALRSRRDDMQLVLTGGDSTRHVPGVRHVGYLDESSLSDALAAATAVVVPSTMESLSMIALQGWAAGRPALLNAASPVLRAQAERSHGALLYSDPADFITAAERLIDDQQLATRLGQAGRAFVEASYAWKDVVARMRRLVEQAPSSAHGLS